MQYHTTFITILLYRLQISKLKQPETLQVVRCCLCTHAQDNRVSSPQYKHLRQLSTTHH